MYVAHYERKYKTKTMKFYIRLRRTKADPIPLANSKEFHIKYR